MSEGRTAERELERRRKEQRLVNAYRRAFDGEDGEAVLKDLAEVFRLDERVFSPVKQGDSYGYDALTAALGDGARGVLIYIRKRLASKAQGDANLLPEEKVLR